MRAYASAAPAAVLVTLALLAASAAASAQHQGTDDASHATSSRHVSSYRNANGHATGGHRDRRSLGFFARRFKSIAKIAKAARVNTEIAKISPTLQREIEAAYPDIKVALFEKLSAIYKSNMAALGDDNPAKVDVLRRKMMAPLVVSLRSDKKRKAVGDKPLTLDALSASRFVAITSGFPRELPTRYLPAPISIKKGGMLDLVDEIQKSCGADLSRLTRCSLGDCAMRVKRCDWSLMLSVYRSFPAYAVDMHQLTALFLFLVCVRENRYQEPFCPNPCRSGLAMATCSAEMGASGACVALGSYSDAWKCPCRSGLTWNPTRMRCLLTAGEGPCVVDHTEKVECGSDAASACTCACREEWMGVTCAEPRDACANNYDPTMKSGNDACTPGVCSPVIGSNMYGCICEDGYTDDANYKSRDCFSEKDPCHKIVCVYGYCEVTPATVAQPTATPSANATSAASARARCVCDDIHAGEFCDQQRPLWNFWREWSECRPACGAKRQRTRRRTCSTPGGACFGDAEATQACREMACRVRGTWSGWSAWSECEAACGSKRSARECLYEGDDGLVIPADPCPGQDDRTAPCNDDGCTPQAGSRDAKGSATSVIVAVIAIVVVSAAMLYCFIRARVKRKDAPSNSSK